MGLKTDIYVRSRDGMNFLFECQTNPVMKGYQSRIADKAYAAAWRKMKADEEFDFAELAEKPLDKMTDAEHYWFVTQIERAYERIRRNLNSRPRYNKYIRH